MGLIEEGARALEAERQKFLTVPAVYVLRDGGRIPIHPTLGSTLFRAENEYGVTIRVESRDFLVSAEELVFTPERGDSVVYGGREYEVLAPNGEPVWRWSGTEQLVRRIHTKEVGSVSLD